MALLIVLILIGAILAFLVWKNQPANPVGIERGASDMTSLRQAVATEPRHDGASLTVSHIAAKAAALAFSHMPIQYRPNGNQCVPIVHIVERMPSSA